MRTYKAIFISSRLITLLVIDAILFVFAFFFPSVFIWAKGLFILLVLALIIEVFVLFWFRNGIKARRIAPEKLSNGDENRVIIALTSHYPFNINAKIIDELPEQLQLRHSSAKVNMPPGSDRSMSYDIRPVKRGEYAFGALNVYVSSIIGLVTRRYIFDENTVIPVYPSFIQMRQYELLAISNRLTEAGIKKVRRVGRTMEFDQVREYVAGDEVRTVNWRATARAATLMVNQYQEEKAQQVYCIIDKGRVMKMPFEGMSLLDYAINASLVVSNIALQKQDRVGLMTFSHKLGAFLPAERRRMQMKRIMDVLYKEKTKYLESGFSLMYSHVRRNITTRSLLLFFTNFESVSSAKRQLPYLQLLARDHLLVVIFFENTELRNITRTKAGDLEEVYIKIMAEELEYEKKQVVKELQRYGIQSILSTPADLTVNSINKYLEIKARSLI